MLKKCDGRTDGRTDERTNGQTDLCIELRYAQLITLAASEVELYSYLWETVNGNQWLYLVLI